MRANCNFGMPWIQPVKDLSHPLHHSQQVAIDGQDRPIRPVGKIFKEGQQSGSYGFLHFPSRSKLFDKLQWQHVQSSGKDMYTLHRLVCPCSQDHIMQAKTLNLHHGHHDNEHSFR